MLAWCWSRIQTLVYPSYALFKKGQKAFNSKQKKPVHIFSTRSSNLRFDSAISMQSFHGLPA